MWLAALRRFALVLVGLAAVVILFSLAIGLLLGASANRSISVGLYVTGCFVMLVGFFFGLRGPMRPAEGSFFSLTLPFLGGGPARRATNEEQRETLGMSGLYVVLGVTLLVLAVAVDSRYRLL
jgi:hypothetical protein